MKERYLKMYNGNIFEFTFRLIDENKMFPEDWENIIFSNVFTDEEVLYLIMYARRKNKK